MPEPLRALIIANSIEPDSSAGIGGAERQALDLAVRFDRSLVLPHLLSYTQAGSMTSWLKEHDIHTFSFEKRWHIDSRVYPFLRRIIATERIDVVLSVNTGANLDNLLVTPSVKDVACIITVPHVGVKLRVALTEGRLAGRADYLIVKGDAAFKAASRQYAIPKARIRVIPNGCDSDRFAYVPYSERRLKRAALGLPEDALILYTPARIHRDKGQDVMAEALAQMPAELLKKRSVLWVNTGRVQNEGLHRRILEITRSIAAHVRLFPPVCDTAEWCAAADWIVMPSRTESFGSLLVEGAFVGRPFISTACGEAVQIDAQLRALRDDDVYARDGGRDARDNNRTISMPALARPGDAVSLAEAIRYAIEMDDDARAKLGDCVCGFVRDRYDMQGKVEAYTSLFYDAVRRRKGMLQD
jgi:glycosyltransferase involved in cell wall biosynthesis